MAGLLSQAAQSGTPITPQLAQTAAQAGAPGPQQPAAPQQQPAAGPQQAAAPGPQQQAPEAPVEQIDPTAPAVKSSMPMDEQQASPEEQQEYERAMKALSMVLYSNDESAEAIVEQIDPNDKVSSTTKANILLIQQLDEKIQMNEVVVPEITREVASRVMELAEARHGIEYGGREAQVIIGATWEGVLEMFGGDPQDVQGAIDALGPEGIASLQKQHGAFLNG